MDTRMPSMSVEVPAELLADSNEHVGPDAKFVSRSEAVRASIRKAVARPDGVDAHHGRLTGSKPEGGTGTGTKPAGTSATDADGSTDPADDGGPAGE